MAKPTLYKILPFDATVGTIIKFSWTGRMQQANVATLYNASGTQVYQKVYKSFKGEHKIPENVPGLVNGQQYTATIIVLDMDEDLTNVDNYDDYSDIQALIDHPSEESNPEPFRCYSEPNFGFEGYSPNIENVVENSSISLTLTYSQAQNEPLNMWTMYLYTKDRVLLDQSPETYATSGMYYWFSGLSNGTEYQIRATGETVHGMLIDTGYIRIATSYSAPTKFINLNAENIKSDGVIHIESFAVSQTGHAYDEDVEYLYDDGKAYAANLMNNYVTFNEELSVPEDFTIFLKLKDVRVINRLDYDSTLRLPESGINEEENTLGETLLYNAFLLLTDTKTGYRYSFTMWKTEDEYQVFMYYNEPGNSYGLWSNVLSFDGFVLDESELDDEMIGGANLLLAMQRKGPLFNIKALSY